ncbi:hypothetical protein FRC17_000020 [Serendipita sp. 399]|nr:hypothetical protein FRC17_000020 [Serendipita sp. 399]
MNHGEVRYGNSYNPYPYGNPSNNVSTASVSSLASTSSKILSLFKPKEKPPPVPEKDYPYGSGRDALLSSSSLSLSMTLSDAGTTTSSHSGNTNATGKRTGSIFKLGKKSKKNKQKDIQPATVIGTPQNVKHELHVDDGLNGFPPEWRASLLQLGYSQEEIEEMIQKKRQKPSTSNIRQLPNESISSNHAPNPSTSSSAYRYPSPPPQFAPPSHVHHKAQSSTSTQRSIPTYHTLKLQTDLAPGEGNPRLHSSNSNSPAAFASPLRSIPNRSESPSGSISSNKQSHGGSEHRASPVPSIHRERDTATASSLSRESPITVSPRIVEAIAIGTPPKPSRPPPPILFSDTLKANTYKPPTVIAIQGDDSDEEHQRSLSATGTASVAGTASITGPASVTGSVRVAGITSPPSPPQTEEDASQVVGEPSAVLPVAQSAALNATPTQTITPVHIQSTANTLPPPDISSPLPTSGDSTPTPDIKATPVLSTVSGIPRISLSLGNVDMGSRASVDWSESLFSALPSATAFDGFRSSVSIKSGPSSAVSNKRSSRIISTPVDSRIAPTPPPSSNSFATATLSPDAISKLITPPSSSGLSSGLSVGPSPGPPRLELTSKFSPFSNPFPSSHSPQSASRVSPQAISPRPSESSDSPAMRSPSSAPQPHGVEDLLPLPRISLGPELSSGNLFSLDGSAHHEQEVDRSQASYRDSIASITTYGDLDNDNDRSLRESISSYGGIEEEYIEPVVVAKATAVKLARVPSVSFQRRLDMMTTSPRSTNAPDVQRGITGHPGAQLVMLQSRGAGHAGSSSAPPFTPLGIPGNQSMPSSAPSTHAYPIAIGPSSGFDDDDDEDENDPEDSDESDEDEDEEEDPDSRYTIRVDNVKADQLMAAIMQSKGDIEMKDIDAIVSPTLHDPQDKTEGRIAAVTVPLSGNSPDPFSSSRPISTASIATLKPERESDDEAISEGAMQLPPSDQEQLPPQSSADSEDVEHVDQEDGDSSALDEWLEANEADEQSQDETNDDDKLGGGDDGSDYDDTDRPLSTPESSTLPKAYQIETPSPVPPMSARSLSQAVVVPFPEGHDDIRSSYSPAFLSPGSVSTDSEQHYDADTSDRGTTTPNTASTNTTGGMIDKLLYLNSPDAVSSGQESASSVSPQWSPIPALNLKQRRESQIFVGNMTQGTKGTETGPAGKAVAGKRASIRPQRSSMIYTSLIQAALEQSPRHPPAESEASELQTKAVNEDKIPKSNLLSKRLPSKCPELLRPLISFINDGDPNDLFVNLKQVAEGESGDIFAADASDLAVSSGFVADSEERDTTTVVAIKKVRVEEPNNAKITALKKEASIFSSIGHHQSILAYAGMWIADTSSPDADADQRPEPLQELWIQMELMERSLADLLALLDDGLELEERHVSRFALDIVLGLAFLEERLVAHRDLRSDNLLVSLVDGHVKIADFSQAIQLSAGDTIREDPAGIIYWQAPEIRRGPYDALKVDVWSLGATVWELVEGETPFEGDPNGPYDRLPELTDVQDVSQGLLGFLASCELPASKRSPAKALLEQDPLFTRYLDETLMDLKANSSEKVNEPVVATPNDSSSDFDDDAALRALGYVPSFKREFSNLSTISFAFSIMGMCSSISTTFDTPYVLGGPAAVVWCWILGSTMCFTLGCSIAEIISAYPTSGGLYMASASLCPKRYRAPVGWVVAWLNLLGQVAGVSSTEYGLSLMVWNAVSVCKDGTFKASQGQIIGLFAALLVIHGLLNCLPTRHLAFITKYFVFVNVGTTLLIIIVLLATTPRSQMNPPQLVFGSQGISNGTSGDGIHGWPTGLAFLFGLLSVQWTMTDYDATAHISEEVKRAAYAAPAAIVIAVIGTGLIGWLFNIILILCSGPVTPELLSGGAVIQIMTMRMGKAGAMVLWVGVCATAFFVVQTAQQATSRTIFAISRDHGLPDRGFFGHMTKATQTPLRAVALATFLAVIPGLLGFASPVAAFAIFAM